MIKKTLTLILLTGSAVWAARAQAPATQPASNIPKIIPPSPTAAAIEKFGTVPVNYATGVPSIGYPMWNWSSPNGGGRLSLSLGLSYHAGGNKVDDMAPNTGLGWALNGLGRVSRTVRGVFDDHPTKGFMYTPVLPQVTTYLYDGNSYINASTFPAQQQVFPNTVAITPNNSPYSNTVALIADNALDGEQDVFSYSFGGGSGRFIIDKNKNIVPLEHTNARIEMSLNTSGNMPEGGTIEAFKITDDRGIEYYFTYKEIQSATTVAYPASAPGVPVQNYISGWLLTKVKDPLTADSITVNYAAVYPPAGYETGFSQSQGYRLGTADVQQGLVINGIRPASDGHSFMSVSYNDPNPTSIILPDGATVQFTHGFNRADLVNAKALTGVEVKNYLGETVKKFGFSYSYFNSGSGAYVPAWASSGNDYNKRLRLDRAEELAVDGGLEKKATVFTYNGTALNPRGSKNIDFWGGNVDPARNNMDYVPITPLDEQEMAVNPDFGAWLPGADRRPDETYMKAGILEKIDWPTGGYSVFEYEANRAFSPIDYYVDSLFATPLNWAQAAFGQNQTIGLTGRTVDKVVFRFTATEAGPRPAPDPNGGQTCFAESQDMQPVAFEITSTDGSFSQTVNGLYAQIVGSNGLRHAMALPLGKTYRVKFVYNTSATCAWQYPFTVAADAVYYTAPQDKLAGGLRIKKITSHDGLAGTLAKTYGYNKPDGHTSATLGTVPDYGYYRSTVAVQNGTHVMYERHINRSSGPTNTLSYYNGSPLLYTRVTETEADGSATVREFDPIVSASNGGTGWYPYLPTQDFANLSGLQLKETAKDNTGITKSEQQTTYTKFQNYLLNQPANRNVKTGVVANGAGNDKYYVADQYFMYTSHAVTASVTGTQYESGQAPLTKTVNNTYDPAKYYPRTQSTTDSRGETREKQYFYAFDEPGAAYTSMTAANMLNYVTGNNYYMPGQVNAQLQQMKTVYALWNGKPWPGSVQTAANGSPLQTDVTFEGYDAKGNILQYTAKDGVTTSFIWGYKGQYPVAKIVGKGHADAVSQSGIIMSVVDNPSSEAALTAELAKLRQLTGCLVSTYTYRPMVGVTTETDPNGKTQYYLYDGFNRLKAVKDKDGNVVGKNVYQLAN